METLNNSTTEQTDNPVATTNDPFDSKFNVHTDLIQDEEGNLWRIQEDLDKWMNKPNTVKKSLRELRANGAKAQLQKFWDKGDFDELSKKWQEIKASQLGTSNIPVIADDIIKDRSKLTERSKFRLNQYPEAELVIKQLLEQGIKASAVVKLFTRPGVDKEGKSIEVEAIGLPTIIARRNQIIYEKFIAGETTQKLATQFSLTTDKIQKIIDDKKK